MSPSLPDVFDHEARVVPILAPRLHRWFLSPAVEVLRQPYFQSERMRRLMPVAHKSASPSFRFNFKAVRQPASSEPCNIHNSPFDIINDDDNTPTDYRDSFISALAYALSPIHHPASIAVTPIKSRALRQHQTPWSLLTRNDVSPLNWPKNSPTTTR